MLFRYKTILALILGVIIYCSFLPVAIAAQVRIEPANAGSANTTINIVAVDFCTEYGATPVDITWDGVPIGNMTGPHFKFEYLVPINEKSGEHKIVVSSTCPATPNLPERKDIAESYYKVVEGTISSQSASPVLSASKRPSPSIIADTTNNTRQKNAWYKDWVVIGPAMFIILAIVAIIVWYILSRRYKKKYQVKTEKPKKEIDNDRDIFVDSLK